MPEPDDGKKRAMRYVDDEKQKEIRESSNYLTTNSIFWTYARTGTGTFLLILITLFHLFTQVVTTGVELLLSSWVRTEQKLYTSNAYESFQNNLTTQKDIKIQVFNSTTLSSRLSDVNSFYLLIYTGTIILIPILIYWRMPLISQISLRTSNKLHDAIFNSILTAPLIFFTDNSSGRILNRFATDLNDLDEILPLTGSYYSQMALEILGVLMLTVIVNPVNLILIVLMFIILYYTIKWYSIAFKNLRRAEGLARSPVISYVNYTLQGLTTIHNASINQLLQLEFDKHLDLNNGTKYLITMCSTGFSLLVELMTALFYVIILLTFFFIDNKNNIGAGLIMSNSSRFILLFQFTLIIYVELLYRATSFERILQYTKLEKEIQPSIEDMTVVNSDWPSEGKIEFINVYLFYRIQHPPILTNINLTILPKEKIGIVGRTGAGKSSIINALFRLAIVKGVIKIDGVNTETLRLETLRSHISIIPQDPTLFSGTLRENLDPFSNYPDYQLIKALIDVGFYEKSENISLSITVTGGGRNFSVGERQLICLARAIIRENKILVLDEATANMDSKTDMLIQNCIRNIFKDCTVLTIAHRLHTVMDSDKILVLDSGVIKEYGAPYELLCSRESHLFKLVDHTGPLMSEYLIRKAKDAYKGSE